MVSSQPLLSRSGSALETHFLRRGLALFLSWHVSCPAVKRGQARVVPCSRSGIIMVLKGYNDHSNTVREYVAYAQLPRYAQPVRSYSFTRNYAFPSFTCFDPAS